MANHHKELNIILAFLESTRSTIKSINTHFFHTRHSLDEVAEFSYQDLDALSILLGDKLFFNGENPSTVDCTIFGHLVQFLYLPLDIPQKSYIIKNCPNLASFVDRMRETFWPDWQELCEGKCMDGKMSVEFK